MTRQRLNVRQAAEALGISVDAVRMRVRRGTLEAERDVNGRLHVWVDTDEPQPDSTALISRLEDEVRFLREELARKDAILLRIAESIPQLEAPERPQEAPASPSPTTREASGEPESGPERPWWRRVFGD